MWKDYVLVATAAISGSLLGQVLYEAGQVWLAIPIGVMCLIIMWSLYDRL